MRKQYYFRMSENGLLAWDVDKLIELSKDFPAIRIPLPEIRELDETFWYCHEGDVPTCRSVAMHVKLINETDLGYPFISPCAIKRSAVALSFKRYARPQANCSWN